MTAVKATVAGERKVLARFRKLPLDVRRQVRPSIVSGAEDIRDMAQRFAPIDDGDLRDSIVTRRGDHELAELVTAGNRQAFYARFVEFGTPTRSATPYFFPSYRALRRRVRARIAQAVRRAIRGSPSIKSGLPERS